MVQMKLKSLEIGLLFFLVMLSICSATVPAQIRTSANRDDSRQKKLRGKEIHITDFGEVTTAKLFGKRDLSKYQRGGHQDCRTYVLDDKRGKCNVDQLGQFILDAWSNKRLGYARLSRNTPDAGGTLHIFVEPIKDGQWTILFRLVRWHALGSNVMIDLPRAYSVGKTTGQSDSVSLNFKDKFGRLIPQLNLDEY